MALIPPEYLDSVVTIGIEDKGDKKWIASGFLYGDIIGKLMKFEEWQNGGEIWQRFEILATQIPRIPADFLEKEERSLGDFFFGQEYICEFRETVDQIFPYDLIMNAVNPDIKPLEF